MMPRERSEDATEARLRAALCDEPVPGIDLDEHAANIAAAVAASRTAEDLEAALRQQVRARY
jgi:hypothetical protein